MDLASEIGVIVVSLGAGLGVDLAGMESLLGGLLDDFSLAERSRTPMLLLTVDAGRPLNKDSQLAKSIILRNRDGKKN